MITIKKTVMALFDAANSNLSLKGKEPICAMPLVDKPNINQTRVRGKNAKTFY